MNQIKNLFLFFKFYIFTFLLINYIKCIPIDNSIISDPIVNCRSDSLSIDIKTSKTFGGRVFVKGYSQDSNCNLYGDGKSNFDFSINFNNCGLRRTREINGVSISAVVVVSFHPIFITKVDRAYKLNCFYLEAKKTLNQQIEVSELTTQTLSKQSTMPVCRYEILSDGPTGKPIKYARIGDHVYHHWICDTDTPGVYCMKVHSCSVSDGQGGEPVLVLNQNGCEIDQSVLQNLDYSNDLSAGQSSYVFKFADKPSLHFNCQVELSLKDQKTGCKYLKPQCSNNNNDIDNYSSNSDNNNENGYISNPTTIKSENGYDGSDIHSNSNNNNIDNNYNSNNQQNVYDLSNQQSSSTTPKIDNNYDGLASTQTVSNIPGYGDTDINDPYISDSNNNNYDQTTQSYDTFDGNNDDHSAEYAQRILPGASYRVVDEKASIGTSTKLNGYDSGYTTKSVDYQTQVAPSSRIVEPQYEEIATPVAIGYDVPQTPPNPAALVFNDFYQDETEAPSLDASRKSAIKRHAVEKRKVADFDLPEQSLVVIEIDEDPISKSSWNDVNETKLTGHCVSTGVFATVTFVAISMAILFCLSIVISVKKARSTELSKYLANKI